jgi:hypothetical protein
MKQLQRRGPAEASPVEEGLAGQKLVLPICRQCGAGYRSLRCAGVHGGCRYMVCQVCGSRFKVAVERPGG